MSNCARCGRYVQPGNLVAGYGSVCAENLGIVAHKATHRPLAIRLRKQKPVEDERQFELFGQLTEDEK